MSLASEEEARANFYALLARLFYAPPDEGLLKALAGADAVLRWASLPARRRPPMLSKELLGRRVKVVAWYDHPQLIAAHRQQTHPEGTVTHINDFTGELSVRVDEPDCVYRFRLDDVEVWIHTCWGNPNMQRVIENDSYVGRKGHGQFVKRGLSQYLV